MIWQFLPAGNDWKWYSDIFKKKYLKRLCCILLYFLRRDALLCSRDRALPSAHAHFTRETTQYWISSKKIDSRAQIESNKLFSLNRTSLVDAVEWRHVIDIPSTTGPPTLSDPQRLRRARRRRFAVDGAVWRTRRGLTSNSERDGAWGLDSSSGSVLKRSNWTQTIL